MKSSSPIFRYRSSRWASRRGQTLVEYALILAFIAVVAIAVLMTMGVSVKNTFAGINIQLQNAQQGGTPSGRGGG